MKRIKTLLSGSKYFRFVASLLGLFYLLSVPFVAAQNESAVTGDEEPQNVAEQNVDEKPEDASDGKSNKDDQSIRTVLSERIEEAKPETWTVSLELDRIKEGKPDHFDSWSERADYIQDVMDAAFNDSITRIDKHYGSELDELEMLQAESSSFKLGTEMTIERDDGISIGLDYDFDTEIELPRLEKKAKLFVRTGDLDELPSSSISERDNGFQVGLSRETSFKKRSLIDNSIGIKVRWLPVLFAESKIRRRWDGETWVIYPQQKFYWESDDGLGAVTSLHMTKWLDDQIVLRSDSGAHITEKSEGVEWDQSIGVFNIYESLVEGDRKSDLYYAYKAAGLRASFFGHLDGGHAMDRYRISWMYRRPLYKRWVYLNVIPEFNWREENDWDTDPGIRLGVELIFGDYYSRYRAKN